MMFRGIWPTAACCIPRKHIERSVGVFDNVLQVGSFCPPLLFICLFRPPPNLALTLAVSPSRRVARAGKVLELNEPRSCTVTNYKRVGTPWEARLLYRTQHHLQVGGASCRRATWVRALPHHALRRGPNSFPF